MRQLSDLGVPWLEQLQRLGDRLAVRLLRWLSEDGLHQRWGTAGPSWRDQAAITLCAGSARCSATSWPQ